MHLPTLEATATAPALMTIMWTKTCPWGLYLLSVWTLKLIVGFLLGPLGRHVLNLVALDGKQNQERFWFIPAMEERRAPRKWQEERNVNLCPVLRIPNIGIKEVGGIWLTLKMNKKQTIFLYKTFDTDLQDSGLFFKRQIDKMTDWQNWQTTDKWQSQFDSAGRFSAVILSWSQQKNAEPSQKSLPQKNLLTDWQRIWQFLWLFDINRLKTSNDSDFWSTDK